MVFRGVRSLYDQAFELSPSSDVIAAVYVFRDDLTGSGPRGRVSRRYPEDRVPVPCTSTSDERRVIGVGERLGQVGY